MAASKTVGYPADVEQEGGTVADLKEAQDAVLDLITASAKSDTGSAVAILQLSEAYAWLIAPRQPHSGGARPTN